MSNSLEPPHFASPETSSPPDGLNRWHWRLEDASGREVTGSAQSGQGFPSQSDAESWVGEVWRDLLDDGVDAVTLLEGDRVVYGPMSLHAQS